MPSRSIVWFRRDLRVVDHPALSEACAAGAVLALFVVDPVFERSGSARRSMLAHAVDSLRRVTGGALVVRHGDPAWVVPGVAEEIDATTVYVTKDYGPYGRRRDAAVGDALRHGGRRLRGVGSPYAVEPGGVVKADGEPYAVFTPFSRRWFEHGWPAPLSAPTDPNWIEAASDAELAVPPVDRPRWEERWREFARDSLDRYDALRNQPAVDGTSRLSADLRFGLVHPRQLLADLDVSERAHAAFAMELAWRDFYADVLFRRPDTVWANLDQRFDRLAVDTDAAARARFELWCAGRTGFPLVDAGMRQLARTGWMHNRLRMVTASFLVKDLHLPWQWGAQHFMARLGDGDLASNNHGWQWAAGSGTDAAPYVRVFNPSAQLERFDPDRTYVSRWIPELGTPGYPAPMVDHAAERVEALARFELVRNAR